jgi:ubiquitin C-terminal hydrolase
MIEQNDAQECLDNLLDKLEDAGIQCPSVSINVVDFDYTGMKAKYNISEKSISVYNKIAKADLPKYVAHELCHAFERLNGVPVIVGGELSDMYDVINTDSLRHKFTQLMSLFKILSRVWTNYEAAANCIEKLDTLIDELYDIASDGDPENEEFCKLFLSNYDKIYDGVTYYADGGHNDDFLNWKDKLSKLFGIEIPTAEN